MSLKKDAGWTAADTFISSGLAFLFRLLVARVLAPNEFGVASMALTTITVLQAVNDFGMTAALIQKDQSKLTPSFINTTFTASFLISAVLFVATFFAFAPLSAIYYKAPAVSALTQGLAWGILTSPFSTVAMALMYRDRNFRDVTIIRVLTTLVSLAVAGGALYIWRDPWVVVWQTLIAQFLSTALLCARAKWAFRPKWDRRAIPELFSYSGLVFANDLAVALAGNLGVFVLGRLLTPADVGLFSLATYMTDTIRKSLMSILNRIMFVHYSRSKDQNNEIRSAYVRTVTWNCRIVFPPMVAIIFFGPELTTHFLGPRWVEMGPVVQWLAFSVMVHAAGGTTSTLYKAVGRPGLDMALFLATTLLILTPGLIFGGMAAGLVGAAIATAVTKLVSIVIRQVMLDRLVGSTTVKVVPVIGLSLLMQTPLVVAWLLARLIWWQPHWVPSSVLACTGAALSLVLGFRPFIRQLLQSRKLAFR